ncbi:hypothetical protein GIB67_020608, partial [Kingdonia uniflora]
AKMHNRQASRQRLIDEDIEAFEASISGRTTMDEGSDLKVLDVITEAPLSMDLPTGEVPITRRHRTIVIEDSKEEETVWGRGRPDSIGNEASSSKTGERSIEFLGGSQDVNEQNFYEMIRVIEGMNAKLTSKDRGLIKWLDIITFYLKNASQNPGPKNSSWNNPMNYIDTLLEASKDWVNTTFDSLGIKREDEGRFPASNRTRYAEDIEDKEKQRTQREDDAVVEDEEMTEAEWQELAVAKQASMVELCEDDLDVASNKEAYVFEDKGYDPDTLEPFPISPELVDGGDLQMKEGGADVVHEAAGSTRGGVETSIIGVTSGRTVDGLVVKGSGSKPSAEGTERIEAEGPVEEEGVTAPI